MFDNLLNQLKKQKNTEVVFNPYSNENVLNNLKIYLNYLSSKISAFAISSIMCFSITPSPGR